MILMTGMWRNEYAQKMCCGPPCETLEVAKPATATPTARYEVCYGKSCFLESLGWGFLQNPILAQAAQSYSSGLIAGVPFTFLFCSPFVFSPPARDLSAVCGGWCIARS